MRISHFCNRLEMSSSQANIFGLLTNVIRPKLAVQFGNTEMVYSVSLLEMFFALLYQPVIVDQCRSSCMIYIVVHFQAILA